VVNSRYQDRSRATSLALRGPLLGAPLPVLSDAFLNAEGGDSADEVKRERLVDRKLDRALCGGEFGKVFGEGFYRGWSGVEADVILEGGEHDQDSVVRECRHTPLEAFGGVRR